MAEGQIFVGLDLNKRDANLELVRNIEEAHLDGGYGYKINQDHAMIWNAPYISQVVETGKPVFVDLKMNNGPRTMTKTIEWLADMGVAYTNIWAHAERNLAKTVEQLGDIERPKILAATFYTRWDDAYAQRHHNMSLEELVRHWSEVGMENGADGIIYPGNLAHVVADISGIKLNPALRIGGLVTESEQEQTSTPYDAFMGGANIGVVGSPIYKADLPVEPLRAYIAEMRRAQADLAAV